MEGMAFDQLKPPLSVTDPRGAKDGPAEWPRHVHKAGLAADGLGPLYLVVQTPEEEAAAIADGWYLARNDALKAGSEAAPAPPPPRKR
jgi:hypothetical protein